MTSSTTIQVPTTLQQLAALQLQLQPFILQVSTKGNTVQYTTIQCQMDQLLYNYQTNTNTTLQIQIQIQFHKYKYNFTNTNTTTQIQIQHYKYKSKYNYTNTNRISQIQINTKLQTHKFKTHY